MDARSGHDVWAVGGRSGGIHSAVRTQAVVVHWNGYSLTTTRFAWPEADLVDVAEIAADDVWAVGSARGRALAAHWDGSRWRRVKVSSSKGAWLSAVAAVSHDDVWAVGGFRKRPLVAHWDGHGWHLNLLWNVAPNFADLRGVVAVPGGGVWASGQDGLDAPVTFGFGDLELRWDGQRWRRAGKVEHSSYDNVGDAAALGPDGEVWELSSNYSGNGADLTRWSSSTGKALSDDAWEPQSVPDLNAIAPLSRTDAWAVGEVLAYTKGADFNPVVAHWNGHTFRRVRTPFDQYDSGLSDIAAVSPTDMWAVGGPLIVRYSC